MAKFIFFGATMVLAGCSSFSVSQDFSLGTDFDPYRSYAWMENQRAPAGEDAFLDQRIRSAVEAELSAKGYGMSESDPDFYVGYQLILQEQVDYQTVNDYWGPGWGYGRVYGPTTTTSRTTEVRYTVGTLVLDFFDADSHDLVWRGSAQGRVNEVSDPEERQRRANEVINAILEQYPPDAM